LKKISVFVLLAFLLTCIVVPAFAQNKEQVDVYEGGKLVKSVVFVVGMKEYFVNGETPGVKMDAAPFIQSGRTFVPIRYLGNALGVTDKYILWKSPKVTFKEPGFPVVELTVGKKQIKSSGVSRDMDVAPVLKSGRTYLPARYVAEALGYEVAWDPQNKVVVCWPKGEPEPDVSAVIEYVKEQQPDYPPGSPADAYSRAMDFEGVPLDLSKFKYVDPWSRNRLEGSKVMHLTVSELNRSGAKFSEVCAVLNMKIDPSKVVLKVVNLGGGVAPSIYTVEEGNIIRYEHGPVAMYGNSITTIDYNIDEFYGADEQGNDLPQVNFSKVTHFIIGYAGHGMLLVDNPLYKK